MKHNFKLGQKVIVTIAEGFELPATIILAQTNLCIVKYDDARYCNNVCRYSELKPVNE